jgi:hypothetical protein
MNIHEQNHPWFLAMGWLSKWDTTCALITLSRYATTLRLPCKTCKSNIKLKEKHYDHLRCNIRNWKRVHLSYCVPCVAVFESGGIETLHFMTGTWYCDEILLKKKGTSFHQRLPNMVQRLFADIITWRDLVYEYSWAKSPMISGYGMIVHLSYCVPCVAVFESGGIETLYFMTGTWWVQQRSMAAL